MTDQTPHDDPPVGDTGDRATSAATTTMIEPPEPSSGQTDDQPAHERLPWYRVPVARDGEGGVLGGVVSGLSLALGFDRRTTRIAVAILAFVLPVVILVYIIAWALLPDRPEQAQPLADVVRDRRRLPLYVALAVVLLATGVVSFGNWFVEGSFPWAVALVAVGVLLWIAPSVRRERRDLPPPTGRSPFVPPPAPLAQDRPVGAAPAAGSTATLGTTETRRRRIPITALTVVAVAVGLLVAAAGEELGWWSVAVLDALVVSGLVLVVAIIASIAVNRTWFLTPVALAIAAATTCLVVAAPDLDHGVGDRTVRPFEAGRVDERLGVGQLTIDLRDVPVPPPAAADADRATDAELVTVTAEVGVGRIHVLVADDVTLVLDAELGAGVVDLDDVELSDGIRHDVERTVPARRPSGDTADAPVIRLDLRIGAGQIHIERGS